ECLQNTVQQSNLKHIAVIMDGNRRWAKLRGLPSLVGHQKGVDSLKVLLRFCRDIGIRAFTVFAFSTENWQRSQAEVGYLVNLFNQVLRNELNDMHKNGVRIIFIGDISAFPQNLQTIIQKSQEKTANNTGITLQIAANYGARQELVRAMQALANQIQKGLIGPEQITDDLITSQLYTTASGDPDLLIRTGGDHRISNYLLWQCAYTELYFTEELWPDFREKALAKAIDCFAKRERRYGK
ncbi:MAG: polyprenyl diphosphate synthase, partial [Cyanobacteria bacterium P01_H01_bin.74]